MVNLLLLFGCLYEELNKEFFYELFDDEEMGNCGLTFLYKDKLI